MNTIETVLSKVYSWLSSGDSVLFTGTGDFTELYAEVASYCSRIILKTLPENVSQLIQFYTIDFHESVQMKTVLSSSSVLYLLNYYCSFFLIFRAFFSHL